MKFRLLAFFKKKEGLQKNSKFSEFFTASSLEKKVKVFKKAAEKANEEQRETFNRVKKVIPEN